MMTMVANYGWPKMKTQQGRSIDDAIDGEAMRNEVQASRTRRLAYEAFLIPDVQFFVYSIYVYLLKITPRSNIYSFSWLVCRTFSIARSALPIVPLDLPASRLVPARLVCSYA